MAWLRIIPVFILWHLFNFPLSILSGTEGFDSLKKEFLYCYHITPVNILMSWPYDYYWMALHSPWTIRNILRASDWHVGAVKEFEWTRTNVTGGAKSGVWDQIVPVLSIPTQYTGESRHIRPAISPWSGDYLLINISRAGEEGGWRVGQNGHCHVDGGQLIIMQERWLKYQIKRLAG